MLRIIPVIAVVFLLIYMIWDSYAIKIEKHEISIKGLPESFDGFTIIHISDIHGRELSERGIAYKVTRQANADLVALTGDFVTNSINEMKNFLPLLRKLSTFIPVYAVSGNHDHDLGWEQVKSKLEGHGVEVLENEYVRLTKGNNSIFIAGVSDPFSGRANLEQALPEEKGEITTILLAHSPTWFEAFHYGRKYQKEKQLLKRVSLTLSGHTHGGQIKIPFIGPLTTASGRLFPNSYIEGLSWEGSGWLYISRGIGYVFIPFRFLSPPEIAILTIRSSN